MTIDYPPRLELAQLPTPLQPLPRLAAALGVRHRLWIKRDDFTDSAVGGNKLRKLEFVCAEAIAQGCDLLITCGGLQSNHCRATALTGARLGLKVHLILRGKPELADGNLLLDHLAGATISCYPPSTYVPEFAALQNHWQQHYREQGFQPWFIPTGASDGIGVWGYVKAAEELAADMQACGIESADVVCATGSGGTQAGLTLGAHLHQVPARVWGVNVCDDADWFERKVTADVAAWAQRYTPDASPPELNVRVIDGYVGPGYGRADAEIFATIGQLASTEGIVLDPVYTGKAFHGMLQELQAGRFGEQGDVVFVHTGGIFGLFPQREAFSQPIDHAGAGDTIG
jgi:D-cysteine desulfhydrase